MKTPDILITDAYLLPEPGTEKVIDHGYVSICDNLITGIGTMANLGDTRARKVIDARGDLVMPGLVNTHCHAPMTLFRGLADDLELVSWLKEYIFPAEAKHVNPEVVYWCSRLAAAEMLLSGTTMVADAYFFENEVARAFSEAGLRAVAAQGIIDFPAPGVPDPLDNVRSAARFLDAWKGRDQLITPAVFA
ncbi:MAG: amidohydrolase family protein, partial [Desulfobulbales bacterium]